LYKANISASPTRGIKQGPFYVLWKSARPSILTELGFLSNPEEEKFLLSEEGQKTVARCLLDAFSKYKQRIDKRSASQQGSTPVEKPAPVSKPKPEPAPAPVPVKEQPATPVVEKTQPVADTAKAEIRAESAAPDPVERPQSEPQAAPQPQPQPTPKVEQPVPDTAGKPCTIEFRVQLAASSNDLELKPYNFKGLSDLSKYYDASQSLYKYYYARSASLEEIRQALEDAKKAGYPSAFVAAFENGRPIGMQEAIEKLKNN
ncbi:MAG: N-acetylmuramoyl-L-alanine amidase, partial [Bacteroidales bacterium]|nr:N-acetylmuramoyl-L-alanine amidase [Bacteroidales bacterium]